MTKLMAKVAITTQKVLHIRVSGMKISKKAKGEKNGLTVHTLKVTISKEKNMDRECSNGLTEPSIMGSGETIKCTE